MISRLSCYLTSANSLLFIDIQAKLTNYYKRTKFNKKMIVMKLIQNFKLFTTLINKKIIFKSAQINYHIQGLSLFFLIMSYQMNTFQIWISVFDIQKQKQFFFFLQLFCFNNLRISQQFNINNKYSYMTFGMLENINKSKREFLNQENISRHLYCVICHQVFQNPSRLACSHTFCLVCIQYWGLLNKKCPICKSSIRQRKLQKDLIAQQIIDDLDVKCSHQNCTWTGIYAQLKKHQRTCEFKPKKQFKQEIFGQKIQIQEIQDQPQQLGQLNKQANKKRKTDQSENGVRLPIFNNQISPQQNDRQLNQGRELFEQSQIVFYNHPPPSSSLSPPSSSLIPPSPPVPVFQTSQSQREKGQISLQQLSLMISVNNRIQDAKKEMISVNNWSLFGPSYRKKSIQRMPQVDIEIQNQNNMNIRQNTIRFQQ